MTRNDNKINWEMRYDAWKESGLSVAAWCRTQDVKDHQMYYWIQKIEGSNTTIPKQDETKTSWFPVQLETPTTNVDEGAVFIHVDSLSVEVRRGADMDVVSNVINLLRNSC